jgi:hypothetical protein
MDPALAFPIIIPNNDVYALIALTADSKVDLQFVRSCEVQRCIDAQVWRGSRVGCIGWRLPSSAVRKKGEALQMSASVLVGKSCKVR